MVFNSKPWFKSIAILLYLQFFISIVTVEPVTDKRLPGSIQLPTFVETTLDFCSDGFQSSVLRVYGPSCYLLSEKRLFFIKLLVNTHNYYRGPPPVNLFHI
ncbi:MAG: hypothetical protein A4E64_01042 [Syntrophorhabdus sp. PtaU1.Bin058]|nr:MAG: hypothetical protein A4E64_01042 [Syntrophorhabdus sp. PtaU1.Bin058]